MVGESPRLFAAAELGRYAAQAIDEVATESSLVRGDRSARFTIGAIAL